MYSVRITGMCTRILYGTGEDGRAVNVRTHAAPSEKHFQYATKTTTQLPTQRTMVYCKCTKAKAETMLLYWSGRLLCCVRIENPYRTRLNMCVVLWRGRGRVRVRVRVFCVCD